jgi:polygalacturonase
MDAFRRDFMKLFGSGMAAAASTVLTPGAQAQTAPMPGAGTSSVYDVKLFGAKGDGTTIDTPAINRAIEAASTAGGGTVRIPAGVYACYSIRLKSNVGLDV